MADSLGYVLAQLQRWTSPNLGELSDAVLLERFVQGRDESAFAALVARHGDMVLRSCCRVLGDAHGAEDAFQAVFLVLARQARTLRQPAALPGFLHSVARRVAFQARTKAARLLGNSLLNEDLPGPCSDPLAQLTARELLEIVDEEVARLPSAQRSAVILCCLEGRPREEAARILGWTQMSLKGHLQRGRQRLQERLKSRGVTLSAALTIVAVSRGEAASSLLLQNTATAALSGGISSSAAALAHSVLKGILLGKLAGMTALVLTVALAASTTVALIYCGPAAGPPQDNSPALPAALKNADADKPQARTDALGDPLPAGAIARLGTVRLRHDGPVTVLTFTPDGKRLISEGRDEVRVWDTATGKELWHVARGGQWFTRGRAALSSDGKRLAVLPSGSAGSVQFWDVDSGKKIGSLGEKFRPPICLSPDGKLLAAGAGLNGIAIWDLAGKKMLRSWKDHKQRNATNEELWSLAFSSDSRKLLSKDGEGMVRLWDAASGRRLQDFKPLSWDDAAVGPATLSLPALCGDGALLAIHEVKLSPSPSPIREPKARISIWDTANGKLARQLAVPSREIRPGFVANFDTMTLAPDGKGLVTTGPDGFLRVWDPATGKELRRQPFDRRFSLLALSRDGKSLAGSARDDGQSTVGATIHILDAATGKDRFSPVGHLLAVKLALLTPDGRTAITGGREKSLLVWDVASGRVRRRLEGSDGHFLALQPSSDGRTLFSISWDKTLRVWDLASGEQRRRTKLDRANFGDDFGDDSGHGGVSFAPLVSPDGKSVVLVDSQKTIRLLDAVSGEQKRHFDLEELTGIALGQDGHTLAGWSGSKRILRVWDAATGRTRRDVPPPSFDSKRVVPWYNVALSPDSRLLAMAAEHCLVLHDLESNREVYRFDQLPSAVDMLIFSPDGHMLACSSFNEPAIRLLETATGRERQRLTGHRGAVETLYFSADGERLISGSSDTTALVWDLSRRFDPRKQAVALSEAKLESLWTDLAGDDAARAYQAICILAASPTSAIPFLRKHLPPILPVDEKRLARLIADLENDEFATRQQAHEQLEKLGEKLGEQVLPAYRKALQGKPSLESRRRLQVLLEKSERAWREDLAGERLRPLRAVEALELAGTKEAREVLKTLAAGAERARLTTEAKAALQHLMIKPNKPEVSATDVLPSLTLPARLLIFLSPCQHTEHAFAPLYAVGQRQQAIPVHAQE